jgi:4-amino-4-deoxy-L-arabinose transferase-like glycosyltransferase
MLPPFRMADGSVTTVSTRSRVIGSAIGFGGTLGCFLLMAREGQLPHATLLGFVLLLGAVFGMLWAFGLLEPPEDAVALRATSLFGLPGESTWFAPVRTLPIAVLALGLITVVAGAARLPYAILAALLVLLLSAVRRPALLVFVICSALYLPWLGSFGLWDPWETHYGEVTREILSRDDWISLWWAQDGWFWSKPILIFWAEALTWSASGVGFRADENPQHIEWVLRLPIFVMAIAGLQSVYFAISRIWTRRAAVLATVVLATTPYYAFLTRQAVTDMPFVANMTVAMMLLIVACTEDPERRPTTLRIGRFGFSLQHAVIALIVLIALPQLLYLVSRNVTWVPPFAWHRDAFLYGSPGNGDVPGNRETNLEQSAIPALWWQPLGQAVLFGVALGFIVWQLRKELRAQALYMSAFYVFCALSFMGKGIPGFALPGMVALLYLIVARRFDLLFEGRLRVGLGIAIVATLGLPWFVAMYVRHGRGFTDRILIHDHINRLTSGVHGDNASIQYFIWQLGYGLFPWIGLVPVALTLWLARGAAADDQRTRGQRDAMHMLGLWFAVSFTLFSAMTTKFHHYIAPAVPPIAAMVGLILDRLLPAGLFQGPKRAQRTAAAMLAPLFWVVGFAGLRGDVRGIVPEDVPSTQTALWVLSHPWPTWLCALLLAAGVALLAFALWRTRPDETDPATEPSDLARLSPVLIAGAVICAFVGRDLSWHTSAPPPGSERLIHLFVYNYGRPWPDYLDYRASMFGFAAVAVILSLLCALRRLRAVAAAGLISLSLAFCVYCLDVYMIDLTPHWSQQGLISRYYQERKDNSEPLLAWQMNWKGENIYTGNHVHVFVDLDNKAMQEWIGKNKGRRVYYLLEHSRLERLKTLLQPRKLEVLTNKRDCNKFLLARVTL